MRRDGDNERRVQTTKIKYLRRYTFIIFRFAFKAET